MALESRGIFLSYASEDSEAARRVAGALTAAGMDVWFDQSELRGGDAWDRRIRDQIQDCALFVPIISANAHARTEGYFRFEWKLAIDRSHRLAPDQAFLLPLVIDGTSQDDRRIPEPLRERQWTQAPQGRVPPAFVERVGRLLSSAGDPAGEPASRVHAAGGVAAAAARRKPAWTWAALALIATGVAGYGAYRYVTSAPPAVARTASASSPGAPAAAFSPPAHSIAVLPFTNLSGNPDQAYFSDGLAEEILTALARVRTLHVAAKTSAFALKNSNLDIQGIARRLNVGAILEGSVQRAGNRLRVTTQLIDTRTGFNLWSEAFDRAVTDVLTVQATIARQVAVHLDSELSGLALAKIGEGTTRSIEAHEAFLRGVHLLSAVGSPQGYGAAAAAFDSATHFDPHFAAAYAMLAHAHTVLFTLVDSATERRRHAEAAIRAADRAVALAPDMPEAYATRGFVRSVALLDFGDSADFERAYTLAPENALVAARLALYSAFTGRADESLARIRRAIELDPLNASWRHNLVLHLVAARQYRAALDSLADYDRAFAGVADSWIETKGYVYSAMGEHSRARDLCLPSLHSVEPFYECLALASHGLGDDRAADRYLQLSVERFGSERSFQHAEICAQLGRNAMALDWLRKAVAARDPSLQFLRTSSALDPIRSSEGYRAIERELHFPTRSDAAGAPEP